MGAASLPETANAMPFADDSLRETFEEQEGKGEFGDVEEDASELCGLGLLDEGRVGHTVPPSHVQ